MAMDALKEKFGKYSEDLKTDQRTQILTVGIILFTIAFPAYFYIAASSLEDGGMGGVGDYKVNATFTTIELENAGEYLGDGEAFEWSLTSDSVDGEIEAAGGNVVGILISLSYGEDESASAACLGPNGADTISASLTKGEWSESGDGTNPGSHEVNLSWYNDSMTTGDVVSGMSEQEINDELNFGDAGLGMYDLSVLVTAQTGSESPPILCNRNDGGEDVSWVVSLIVLDFTVVPHVEMNEGEI